MPQGATTQELDEFALALADVVLSQPAAANLSLLRRAAALGRTVITPGDKHDAAPA